MTKTKMRDPIISKLIYNLEKAQSEYDAEIMMRREEDLEKLETKLANMMSDRDGRDENGRCNIHILHYFADRFPMMYGRAFMRHLKQSPKKLIYYSISGNADIVGEDCFELEDGSTYWVSITQKAEKAIDEFTTDAENIVNGWLFKLMGKFMSDPTVKEDLANYRQILWNLKCIDEKVVIATVKRQDETSIASRTISLKKPLNKIIPEVTMIIWDRNLALKDEIINPLAKEKDFQYIDDLGVTYGTPQDRLQCQSKKDSKDWTKFYSR